MDVTLSDGHHSCLGTRPCRAYHIIWKIIANPGLWKPCSHRYSYSKEPSASVIVTWYISSAILPMISEISIPMGQEIFSHLQALTGTGTVPAPWARQEGSSHGDALRHATLLRSTIGQHTVPTCPPGPGDPILIRTIMGSIVNKAWTTAITIHILLRLHSHSVVIFCHRDKYQDRPSPQQDYDDPDSQFIWLASHPLSQGSWDTLLSLTSWRHGMGHSWHGTGQPALGANSRASSPPMSTLSREQSLTNPDPTEHNIFGLTTCVKASTGRHPYCTE